MEKVNPIILSLLFKLHQIVMRVDCNKIKSDDFFLNR